MRVAYLNFITDKIQSLLCDISSSQKISDKSSFFGNPFENVEHLNRSHTGQRKSISHIVGVTLHLVDVRIMSVDEVGDGSQQFREMLDKLRG